MPVSNNKRKKSGNSTSRYSYGKDPSYRAAMDLTNVIIPTAIKKYKEEIYPRLFGPDVDSLPEEHRIILNELKDSYPAAMERLNVIHKELNEKLMNVKRYPKRAKKTCYLLGAELEAYNNEIANTVLNKHAQFDQSLDDLITMIQNRSKGWTDANLNETGK